ncbi:MAG: hypothetical protein H7Y62_15120 [Hyphomicrobium sp.]|nr:hypothetical protein [Hyphomicrobium sp.]
MAVREAPDPQIVTTGMDYNWRQRCFCAARLPYDSAAAALPSATTLG